MSMRLHNKSINELKPPTDSTKNENRSLAQSHSTRRLHRKPTPGIFNSPKPKLHDKDGSDLEIKMFESPVPCRFVRNSAKFQYCNEAQIDDIYGILPKNAKISRNQSRFQSPKSPIQNVLSIQKIQIEQSLDLTPTVNINRNGHERNGQRKQSKTTKQFHMPSKKKQDIFIDHFEPSQSDSSLNLIRQENIQLLTENNKLKERMQDLKEENQYMYTQIENFHRKIRELTEENQRLAKAHKMSCEKVEEYREEAQHFKKLCKDNQNLFKNYSVLEHVYSKLKYENQAVEKRNQTLTFENEKLLNKVATLNKLLDESPRKNNKSLSKSKSRELSPVYNKQNCQSQPTSSLSNSRGQKLNKTSRKDEGLFQLSPE